MAICFGGSSILCSHWEKPKKVIFPKVENGKCDSPLTSEVLHSVEEEDAEEIIGHYFQRQKPYK